MKKMESSAAETAEARRAEFGRRPRTGAAYFRVGVATADGLHRHGDFILMYGGCAMLGCGFAQR